MQEVFKTLLDVSIAQQKELHIEDGCRIKASLHPEGKQIFVRVWPCINYEEAEIDFGNHAFAQNYMIKSNILFPKSVIGSHPIFGSDSKGWEMSVISKDSMRT